MKKNDIAPFYQSFGASFKESLLLRKRVQKEGEHNWQQIAAIKVERGDESVSGQIIAKILRFCTTWHAFAHFCQMSDIGTPLRQLNKHTITLIHEHEYIKWTIKMSS